MTQFTQGKRYKTTGSAWGIPQRILFCPNVPKTAFIIYCKVLSKKIDNGRWIGDSISTKKKKFKI